MLVHWNLLENGDKTHNFFYHFYNSKNCGYITWLRSNKYLTHIINHVASHPYHCCNLFVHVDMFHTPCLLDCHGACTDMVFFTLSSTPQLPKSDTLKFHFFI
jgi:hypothetical protein